MNKTVKYNTQPWRPIHYAADGDLTLPGEKPVKDSRILWSGLSFSEIHSLYILLGV